ncbi:MAG TPA: peptidoglycan editing factor PgeF [Thermoanaerobaculia bacterium]|nr:peptidoglycan editing factor PgeF [Thermoanaerobaculia bacterium]
MIEGPFQEGGQWFWRARKGDDQGEVEVRFAGRGAREEREDVLHHIEPDAPSVAWAKQFHSARVLPAHPGNCGEGDALFSDAPDLALSVVTADCVPILLAGPQGLAAVHAGWRGLVGGVIPAALQAAGGGEGWTAWIGPTIGPCCYEVGEDVAEQVAAVGGPDVVIPGPDRPHLDLVAAARHQLKAAGVEEVYSVASCTRCEAERLYSYRREGQAVGRNAAFIWRRSVL